MYQVVVERAAGKDLKRLASGIQPRITIALRALTKNPRPAGSRKLAGTKNDWQIRVGDYRVIYEIADVIRVVRILRIRHRREVYR